jgi:basic amino acid/polyamine antiporter, APA family
VDLLRTKSIEQSLADTEVPEFHLKRRLTALDLTVFGVGVIIGAGIFTLTGRVAQANAGPAVALSFVLAAVCCGLAALCYAEFASTVPVSGSAYTFSYATLGELIAWIIGWDLLLEMMLGASVVAQGWAAYFETFLDEIGLSWPENLGYGDDFNLAAFLLVIGLTALVAYGIKESLRVNLVLVAVKLFIVLFVIFAGIGFINTDNYHPFIPPAQSVEGSGEWLHTPLFQLVTGSPAAYGVGGVIFAASLVFFAYIGFDVVATTAEEAAHPQRDLPIGILGSLAICTVLYVAVALVITGMVPYQDIHPDAALANAFVEKGKDGYATLISAGAVAGLTTVVMTLLIGAVRVTFAMSRDNLLPQTIAHVAARTGTPVRLTIGIGLVVALVASLTPVGRLEEMVNIGTLTAFFLVSIAIPILRKRRGDLERSFRVPWSPWLPWLSAAICLFLMLNLTVETWLRFLVWMVLGFGIYFTYGYRNSRVGRGIGDAAPDYSR